MKLYKKIAWSIVLIPVLLAITIAFATAPVGRRYVNAHGEELIGRKINIEDFRFNILTGNISLGDACIYESNGDSVFASVKSIKLGLSMIDLIKGKIHIEDFDIKRPVVNIIQKGNKHNYDDLVEKLCEGESSEYTIDDFELSRGTINYLDLTEPSVPFSYSMTDVNVDIKNFNTSDHNHIEMEAELGDDGEMKVVYDGMLSDQRNIGVTLEIEDLDLVSLSPLFVQVFGREVESGTLNLTSEITTVNGHLSGNNHVLIKDPKVNKVKDLPFKPEYRKLPMKAALKVLTDRDRKCEMDLPVSGDIDNPRFSYKRAVLKCFGKYLVKLVTSPFYHPDSEDE